MYQVGDVIVWRDGDPGVVIRLSDIGSVIINWYDKLDGSRLDGMSGTAEYIYTLADIAEDIKWHYPVKPLIKPKQWTMICNSK